MWGGEAESLRETHRPYKQIVCVFVCVRARACARACVRACVRACIPARMRTGQVSAAGQYVLVGKGAERLGQRHCQCNQIMCMHACLAGERGGAVRAGAAEQRDPAELWRMPFASARASGGCEKWERQACTFKRQQADSESIWYNDI